MASLTSSVHSLNNAVDSLDQRLCALDAKVQSLATAGAPAAPAPAPVVVPVVATPDPLLVKRIGDLEAAAAALRESIKTISDDLRMVRTSIAQDRGLIEATLTAKLEQSINRMLRDRIATAADDVLTQAKMHVADQLSSFASSQQVDAPTPAAGSQELGAVPQSQSRSLSPPPALQAQSQSQSQQEEPPATTPVAASEASTLPPIPELTDLQLAQDLSAADSELLQGFDVELSNVSSKRGRKKHGKN